MPARFAVALLALCVVAPPRGDWANGQEPEAAADAPKPVAVVGVASLSRLLGDARFVAQEATGGQVGQVFLLAGGWLQGLDTARPCGVLYYMEESGPRGVGFVPVVDFDRFIGRLEERLGKARDTGRGIYRLSVVGQTDVYYRLTPQWVFVADARRHLLKLPQQPLEHVTELVKEDTIALRFNFDALPEATRKLIREEIDGLVTHATELMQQRQGSRESVGKLQVELQQQQLRAIRQFLEDAQSVTLGGRVLPAEHRLSAHLTLKFAPGSQWVQQWKEAQAEAEAGDLLALRQPDAAVTFYASSRLTETDQATWKSMLSLMREQVITGLKQDGDSQAQQLTPTITQLFDQLQATVADREMAMSGTLWLEDRTARFGVAMRVHDGAKLDQVLRQYVNQEQNQPHFPTLRLDVARAEGVVMHELRVDLPEEEKEARLVFGPQLSVTLGFGPKVVYLVLGEGGTAWLKDQLNRKQSAELEPGMVMETVVALGPLLRNLPEADPVKRQQMRRMARLLEGLNHRDRIHLSAYQTSDTIQYRLDVGDGVLKLLGAWTRLSHDEER